MTKNIKKVGLLKDSAPATKAKLQAATTNTAAVTANQNAAATTATPSNKGSIVGKILSYVGILLLLAVIVVPKPELLRYQKMNTVTTSIYWPGVFGVGAGLLDSHLSVYIDNARQELNLCYQHQQSQQCSRYQIVHQGGLVDVIMYLLER